MKLGKTTRELVEVTQGLEAGEQVVLNPQPDDPDLETVSTRSEIPSAAPRQSRRIFGPGRRIALIASNARLESRFPHRRRNFHLINERTQAD